MPTATHPAGHLRRGGERHRTDRALPANASTTTASNNYAKPWIGTFQLLNDSGQPVTLPNGFNGNVTLSAEGATSTVGSTTCPSGSEAATTSGLRHRRPALRPDRLHAGRRRHRDRADQPAHQAGHGVEHVLQPLQHAAHARGPPPDRAVLHGPDNADTPLAAGTVCGGLDGQGHIGYAAQSGLATFGPDVFTAAAVHHGDDAAGFKAVSGHRLRRPCTAPSTSTSAPGVARQAGQRRLRRHAGAGGAAGCGTNGGNGGNGGNGTTTAGHGGNGGNGGNGACPPEEWVDGIWLTATGSPTTPTTRRRATARGATAATAATVATASDRPGRQRWQRRQRIARACPARTARTARTARSPRTADALHRERRSSRQGPGASSPAPACVASRARGGAVLTGCGAGCGRAPSALPGRTSAVSVVPPEEDAQPDRRRQRSSARWPSRRYRSKACRSRSRPRRSTSRSP